jgi:hypothetical protein
MKAISFGSAEHERVLLEHGALARRLDVRVERLQAAGRDLQQLVHQQQELALELLPLPAQDHDLAHLHQHLAQDVERISEHHRADARAADDQQLPRAARSRGTRRR